MKATREMVEQVRAVLYGRGLLKGALLSDIEHALEAALRDVPEPIPMLPIDADADAEREDRRLVYAIAVARCGPDALEEVRLYRRSIVDKAMKSAIALAQEFTDLAEQCEDLKAKLDQVRAWRKAQTDRQQPGPDWDRLDTILDES